MIRAIRAALDWLTLADYDRAKAAGTKAIVKRYTRGNIFLKNGLYLDKTAIDRLSVAGDRASARLKRLAHIS